MISPIWTFVVFEELAVRVLLREQAEVDRVKNSHGTVETVKRAFETMFFPYILCKVIWILVGDPAGVNWVHENVVILELLSWGPRDHVQGSFGHVGMRMEFLFALTVEDTFHWRDIYYPWRCWADHFWLQLTDEVERNDGVDDLSCIAVHQRYIFYFLDPGVCGPLVDRLAELIKRSKVDFLWLCYLAWQDTWKWKLRIALDDSQSIWLYFIGKL